MTYNNGQFHGKQTRQDGITSQNANYHKKFTLNEGIMRNNPKDRSEWMPQYAIKHTNYKKAWTHHAKISLPAQCHESTMHQTLPCNSAK